MLQYTLRMNETFRTTFEDENINNFSYFPFDKNLSKFKFELSHFELKPPGEDTEMIYRFDFF